MTRRCNRTEAKLQGYSYEMFHALSYNSLTRPASLTKVCNLHILHPCDETEAHTVEPIIDFFPRSPPNIRRQIFGTLRSNNIQFFLLNATVITTPGIRES